MQKILNKAQILEHDKITIERQGISSIDLMERAAGECVKHLEKIIKNHFRKIHIVCGKGNNGGDGLVIARILSEKYSPDNLKINVFIAENSSSKESYEFSHNYRKLEQCRTINICYLNESNLQLLKDEIFSEHENSIVVDAIYGIGLNKEVNGSTADIIKLLNLSGLPIISIDVPSGMYADVKQESGEKIIIQSELTLTFQQPKYNLLLSENGPFCKEFLTIDIGLDQEFLLEADCKNYTIEKKDIVSLLKKRAKFSHKGNYGHALIIAGSKGKIGAAVLASKACLKSGAGLLTVHVPASGTQILQSVLPEAMVSEDLNPQFISDSPETGKYNCVGIGPGLGTHKETELAFKQLIQKYQGNLVIDADAINLLAENKTLFAFLPPMSILTPHPKEFDRLTEKHNTDFERIETAKDLATKHQIILILKSAHTAIITPSKSVFFNTSGNPGMSKGGNGDVLTGILIGLLARGYDPLPTALVGVFIHGYAADKLIEKHSEESILPSEIINNLSSALFELEQAKSDL